MIEQAATDPILEFVKRTRGFDFTGYKRSSLERRIAKRMDEVGATTATRTTSTTSRSHPDEFAALFNTILINVTAFFRDAQTWDAPRARRSCPGCSPAARRTRRCASGAPAARPARRRTRSRCVLAEVARRDGVPRAREDLRHRRRRRRARPRRGTRATPTEQCEGVPARAASTATSTARDAALTLPQGPAARGDLRPQRPRAGRADLAHRPAARAATRSCTSTRRRRRASCAASTSRSSDDGVLVARQVRDADHARRSVHADRPQAAHLHARWPRGGARPTASACRLIDGEPVGVGEPMPLRDRAFDVGPGRPGRRRRRRAR